MSRDDLARIVNFITMVQQPSRGLGCCTTLTISILIGNAVRTSTLVLLHDTQRFFVGVRQFIRAATMLMNGLQHIAGNLTSSASLAAVGLSLVDRQRQA